MATVFGEEKSVDTHFCQWLVSISLHSTFASNISTLLRFQVLPRALVDSLMIRVERQNSLMALVMEQTLSEELVQEPYKTLKFFAVIFTESLAFFTKVTFLLYCTCQRALVFINSL